MRIRREITIPIIFITNMIMTKNRTKIRDFWVQPSTRGRARYCKRLSLQPCFQVEGVNIARTPGFHRFLCFSLAFLLKEEE